MIGRFLFVALGVAVGTACSGDGGDSAAVTSTTVVDTTVTTSAPTTIATTTTAARRAPATTRTTVRTTTTARPAATTAPAPSTTRAVLTRAAATQSLCKELETSVRLVSGGNTVGGGLRLSRAIGTYGDAADPSVTAPARRVLSAALAGDIDSSAAAVHEAATACGRLGFPIVVGVQCVTTPCP